jgi:histidinol-phosphate aminotransferase
MLKLAEQHVLSLEPYVPGKAIENDKGIAKWAKLGSNENCLGASSKAIEAARLSLAKSHLYPNAHRLLVIDRICEHLQKFAVRPENIALGNGTSELIVNLVRGVLGPKEAILFGWPSFVMYRLAATAHGREYISVPLVDMGYDLERMHKEIFSSKTRPVKLVIIANPNNPTGAWLDKQQMNYFIEKLPDDVILAIDEAYFEYVSNQEYPNGLDFALARPRTIVLRTFSKVYGLAGLRIGYAVGDQQVINVLCRIRDPFNVNAVAQQAAIAALEDEQHVAISVEHNLKMKEVLQAGLRDFGFFVHDSVANFLLVKRAPHMPTVADLSGRLLKIGVIIRPLDTYGMPDYARISVGTAGEIDQLFSGLSHFLAKEPRTLGISV